MKFPRYRHDVEQPQDSTIKLIALTQGVNSIVDADLYEYLNQWNWRLQKDYRTKDLLYAVRWDVDCSPKVLRFLHHIILPPKEGFVTDHIDGNGLNNRRANLRYATKSQNRVNSKVTSKTGYKGVCLLKETRRGRPIWQAAGIYSGKSFYCGRFDSPEEASAAFQAIAKKLHGEFFRGVSENVTIL